MKRTALMIIFGASAGYGADTWRGMAIGLAFAAGTELVISWFQYARDNL
jgi:hypothetical protein